MATITESLERSLQNCSLNHERRSGNNGGGGGGDDGLTGRSSTSDDNNNHNSSSSSGGGGSLPITESDTSLELNSHLSLPYHWEQCLDLKSGEIYYINWMNGMKAREDPRTAAAQYSGDFYSEEDDDDDDNSYDSEELPSESSPCSTKERKHCNDDNDDNNNHNNRRLEKDRDNVLVVAGCKSCLMYYMVPKQVEDCPKCNGQLLHFDRSESSSP
ncbi:hypothetical protein V6N13_005768 [Hibiscus sabdariffa]|uniref:Uncharacterized protein n=1 Tax=Hibiscus sabdariffa TaxID=183260 RepID=A0ABR2EPS6_9ROSI